MKILRYGSSEEIRRGDRIRYWGAAGVVDFVAASRSGDPQIDWFLDQWPQGGVMITAEGFGAVFVDVVEAGEKLEFVCRSSS